MNRKGSYRALRENSKSAICASIEIYNKPNFEYRMETFVVLLLNAWELLFKSILSKNGHSIYYYKARNEPYKTLSLMDSMKMSAELFPSSIPFEAVSKNVESLKIYRDNAIHFYNVKDFETIIYGLAQTSIVNFRDVFQFFFNRDLADEVTLQLLPLSFKPPVDPIAYMKRESETGRKTSPVTHFLKELSHSISDLESAGIDTGRMMTIWNIKLESVKKVTGNEITVGVGSFDEKSNPLIVERRLDPNKSHPLIASDIYSEKTKEGKIQTLHGIKFTQFVFLAVARKFDIKNNRQYCWQEERTKTYRYANDLVSFIKRLTKTEVVTAVQEYKDFLKQQATHKKKSNR